MNVFESEHGLGQEHWAIPGTRRARVLVWCGGIQFGLALLAWAGAAATMLAWMATEPPSWGHFALAALFVTVALAVSGRAVFLACRPDVVICESGLLLGRTAKLRRELRWEEPFTCDWRRHNPTRLVVKTPHEILEYRIPADSRERLSAELCRRGKWVVSPK
jgi:hypothetical protein